MSILLHWQRRCKFGRNSQKAEFASIHPAEDERLQGGGRVSKTRGNPVLPVRGVQHEGSRIHYSSFFVLHNVHNKRGGGGQNRVFQDNYKEPSVEYLSAAKKKKKMYLR